MQPLSHSQQAPSCCADPAQGDPRVDTRGDARDNARGNARGDEGPSPASALNDSRPSSTPPGALAQGLPPQVAAQSKGLKIGQLTNQPTTDHQPTVQPTTVQPTTNRPIPVQPIPVQPIPAGQDGHAQDQSPHDTPPTPDFSALKSLAFGSELFSGLVTSLALAWGAGHLLTLSYPVRAIIGIILATAVNTLSLIRILKR
jgi:hypothetical protein